MGQLEAVLPARELAAVITVLNQAARATRTSRSHKAAAQTLDGQTLDGQTLDGQMFDGQTLDGRAVDGQPVDGQTADQRRADALVAPFLAALGSGVLDGPVPTRIPVTHVHLSVPAVTLLGLADDPGELAGYGPVPASVARAIAGQDAAWYRVLTHPVSGQLLATDTTAYRPGAVLEQFVRTRDQTCRIPICGQPARHADLDHTIPWPRGETVAANLGALCRQHHQFKHHSGATLEQPRPGSFRWHMPTGHVVDVPAEPHGGTHDAQLILHRAAITSEAWSDSCQPV